MFLFVDLELKSTNAQWKQLDLPEDQRLNCMDDPWEKNAKLCIEFSTSPRIIQMGNKLVK